MRIRKINLTLVDNSLLLAFIKSGTNTVVIVFTVDLRGCQGEIKVIFSYVLYMPSNQS